MPEPKWQHGYRCHGYWIELSRVGIVSIPPGAKASVYGYDWAVEVPLLATKTGWSPTLIAAKRAVEKMFADRALILKEMGKSLEVELQRDPEKWL